MYFLFLRDETQRQEAIDEPVSAIDERTFASQHN